jgi:hypothetical protein
LKRLECGPRAGLDHPQRGARVVHLLWTTAYFNSGATFYLFALREPGPFNFGERFNAITEAHPYV